MAFVITLVFDYEVNTSLQVGDQVYHTATSLSGGFEQNNNIFGGQTHIGVVQDILPPDNTNILNIVYGITVFSEHVDLLGNPLPGIEPIAGDYISFSKNRIVNNNELLGYYGLVKFENDSIKEAELYSVGSGITENSK